MRSASEPLLAATTCDSTHTSGQETANLADAIRLHLVALFVLETVALTLLALPRKMWFESYLLRDQATYLGWQYLLSHGFKVNVDFGYQYGLLLLLMVRAWFSLFPSNDLTIQPLFLIINLISAVGIARFAKRMRLNGLGLLFLAVTLPIALQPENTCYLETAFLTNALAEQAGGRRDRALALATASCFAKPTMGYVYGVLLILFIGFDLLRRGIFKPKAILGALAPAAATGVVLALLLGAGFGGSSVVSTVLPLRGMQTYQALNFGFFTGSSRSFWYFPGVRIGYYLGTPIALWLSGSLFLIFAGIRAVAAEFRTFHLRPSGGSPLDYEIVFTCAALHVVFVTTFYGSPSSWTYYAFILAMGIAVAASWSPPWRYATAGFTVLALIGNFTFLRTSYRSWLYASPREQTAYLWSSPTEGDEWSRVLQIVRGAKTTLLVPECGGELIGLGFEKPVAAILVPGNSVVREVDRKAQQISQANFVVRPTPLALGSSPDDVLNWWPQLRLALRPFRVVWTGEYFKVYGKSAANPSS